MNPLVSIIIPTYNRAHLIGETLDSVLTQTYTNWECIVVDDGSNDYTDELLEFYCKRDSRIQYHHRPKDRPKGANACRNYGFELSKGEYVNWFDSDDLMDREKLKIQTNILKENKVNFCVCQFQIFKTKVESISKSAQYNIWSNNVFSDFLLKKIIWGTPAVVWGKSFLDSLPKLFDEDLNAAQEWEFHSRVLLNQAKFYYTDKVLIYIREHENSITYQKKDTILRDQSYVKARILIYQNLEGYEGYRKEKNYLIRFILTYYKKFLRSGNYEVAKEILNNVILKSNSVKPKLKLICFLSYFSFKITNRGFFFTKKIDY